MKVITRMGKFLSALCPCKVCDERRKDTTTSTSSRILSMWLAFSLSLCGLARGTAVAAENNLLYKEYWYRTEQLCPDLQEAVAGKDIDIANLPYKSVFRFMDHLQSLSDAYADMPCILEANGPQRLVSTALIEAVHVDTRPWNFSGAQACEEHIKLRFPEPTFLKRSSVPKIICRIPRSKARSGESKEATGSLYHPYIWQFAKGKLGLSFSSFNLSHLIQPLSKNLSEWNSSQHEEDHEPGNQGKNYWLSPDPSGNQYVQMVFQTRFAGVCTLRVQQYLVDAQRTLCEGVQQRSPFQLCGLYDCSEKETILKTLGFWTHRKEHEQLDVLLQADIPRWRREDPSYLQILVSTLRALIMPLLFLSVFYVTRRLRLKLASRHHTASRTVGLDRHRNVLRQRQCYLRSLMRDGGRNDQNGGSSTSSDISSEHMLRPSLILNHAVYDIPVGEGFEDLPPPYESIIQPPSYLEATTTVKPSSSPAVENPSQPGCESGDNSSGNESNGNISPPISNHDSADEEMVGLISHSGQTPNPQVVAQQSRSLNSSSNSNFSA